MEIENEGRGVLVKGILKVIRRAGLLAVIGILSLLCSFAIAWPLWYAATRWPGIYTMAGIILLGLLILVYGGLKLIKAGREVKNLPEENRLKAFILRLAALLVLPLLVFAEVWLFNTSAAVLSLPAGIVFFIIFGIIKYAEKKSWS